MSQLLIMTYAEKVADKMLEITQDNLREYGESLDPDDILERAIDYVDVPEHIVDAVVEHRRVTDTIDEIEYLIEESSEWGNGTLHSKMRYNGLSQSDFI